MIETATLLSPTRPSTGAGARPPISVCLLVGSLEFGGAERQVVEMTRSFDRRIINPFICSLSRENPLARLLPRNGEELVVVPKRGRFDFTAVIRVARLLRQRKVEVVHAFLFGAEIAARLAARLARVPVVIASERNADYVRPRRHTIALKATRGLFDVMVANSYVGREFNMRTLGLPGSRIEVVHNGVDVERFHPDRPAGLAFRKQLGIPSDVPLIGMVGSYKRQKAQDVFLRMAARVAGAFPEARFLLVGEPVRDNYEATSRFQAEVRKLAEALKISDRCHFLGNQRDMNSVYNSCDCTALLSRREGTPNVVLESMACGVPVIVSDIADNAHIVLDGETGFVVLREDAEIAAAGALRMLRDGGLRRQMGEAARSRACDYFSLRIAAAKLEAIYTQCLSRKREAA